jgi:hypothetical protein
MAAESEEPLCWRSLPLSKGGDRVERSQNWNNPTIAEISDALFEGLICLTEANDDIAEDVVLPK